MDWQRKAAMVGTENVFARWLWHIGGIVGATLAAFFFIVVFADVCILTHSRFTGELRWVNLLGTLSVI